MGLATIDPHSPKVQTKFYKICKFGVNRPNCTCEPFGRCPTQRPDAIHFFVNFDILKWLYLAHMYNWVYCWFSHDVTKFQTSELLILLRFYFHDE